MKISKSKKEKISEQILALLYSIAPASLFTSYVAKEIARDEEFVKGILMELKEKKLVTEIKKNPKGASYIQRMKWKISDLAYDAYKNRQNT